MTELRRGTKSKIITGKPIAAIELPRQPSDSGLSDEPTDCLHNCERCAKASELDKNEEYEARYSDPAQRLIIRSELRIVEQVENFGCHSIPLQRSGAHEPAILVSHEFRGDPEARTYKSPARTPWGNTFN